MLSKSSKRRTFSDLNDQPQDPCVLKKTKETPVGLTSSSRDCERILLDKYVISDFRSRSKSRSQSPARQIRKSLCRSSSGKYEDTEKPDAKEIDSLDRTLKPQEKAQLQSVLDPKFQPEKLLHREEETKALLKLIAECVQLKRSQNIFISGQPGTGKTASVNHILEGLECGGQQYLQDNLTKEDCDVVSSAKLSFRVIRINAMNFSSTKDLLVEILARVSRKSYSSNSTTESIVDKIFTTIREEALIFTIILIDEFDAVTNRSGGTYLVDFYTKVAKEKSLLATISISNSIETIVKLTEKQKALQKNPHVTFKPYNANQIYEILKARIDFIQNFKDNGKPNQLFEQQSILFCAKKLHSLKGGDIRAALDVLLKTLNSKDDSINKCKDTADTSNKDSKIQLHDVKKVCEDYSDNPFEELFNSFPLNQKVLILSIYRQTKKNFDSEINSRELLSAYNKLCTILKLPTIDQSTVSECLSTFADYQIVEHCKPTGSKSKKGLSMSSTNRNLKSESYKLLTDLELVKQTLESFKPLSALI